MIFMSVLSKILPIIFLLCIGVLLKRSAFISESTVFEIKKLIINISLPALLFFSFLNTDFHPEYLILIVVIFIVNICMLFIGIFFKSTIKGTNIYFPLLFTGFEMGMLGFSFYGSVFGVENISYIGVLDLGQELFVWFILSSILLSYQKGRSASLSSSLKSFISSPVILSITCGVVLNIVGLKALIQENTAFSSITTTLTLLSQITIPLILLVIGYQLNFRFSKMRLPLITISIRLVFLMLIAIGIDFFIIKKLLHLSREFSIALYTMFILPPPFIIPLYMTDEETSLHEYVGNTLSVATIITIIGFVLIVFVSSIV